MKEEVKLCEKSFVFDLRQAYHNGNTTQIQVQLNQMGSVCSLRINIDKKSSYDLEIIQKKLSEGTIGSIITN